MCVYPFVDYLLFPFISNAILRAKWRENVTISFSRYTFNRNVLCVCARRGCDYNLANGSRKEQRNAISNFRNQIEISSE